VTQHSIYAPSAFARTLQCPAHVTLEQQFPEGDRDAANEGDAAHWVAAERLQGREHAVATIAPNGVPVTDEMIEGADLYERDVRSQLVAYGMTPEADAAVEQSVAIPAIHSACWGTPDCRAWAPTRPRPTLFLWDYKFGHRYVEAYENAQCAAYVSGCMSATRLSDLEVDVVVTIVQPRSYHADGPVRRWKFAASDIRALVNRLTYAVALAGGQNPPAKVGPECRDCRARAACVALQRAGQDACDAAMTAHVERMPPGALGVELRVFRRARALLDARISGLEEQALASIKAGQRVPHWKVQHGQGRTVWSRPVAEVVALGDALRVNVRKPAEALTPKQAIKAGLPAAVVSAMSVTPSGAAELVEDDGSDARRIFG